MATRQGGASQVDDDGQALLDVCSKTSSQARGA